MIDVGKIRGAAEDYMAGTDMFVVEIACSPSNEIEVLIDSDSSVSIDACVDLSRRIESAFDREAEDFELTVASWGIGRPLKMLRQYLKLAGKPVEVVLKDGGKVRGTLLAADEESVTVGYVRRVAVEGSKKKKEEDVVERYPLAEVKSTVEYIDFK